MENKKIFKLTKSNCPKSLRGSIVKWRRKCGNKNCKCAKGELHESWVLSYSEKNKTRMIGIKEEYLDIIKNSISNYKKKLSILEKKALEGNIKLKTLLLK